MAGVTVVNSILETGLLGDLKDKELLRIDYGNHGTHEWKEYLHKFSWSMGNYSNYYLKNHSNHQFKQGHVFSNEEISFVATEVMRDIIDNQIFMCGRRPINEQEKIAISRINSEELRIEVENRSMSGRDHYYYFQLIWKQLVLAEYNLFLGNMPGSKKSMYEVMTIFMAYDQDILGAINHMLCESF